MLPPLFKKKPKSIPLKYDICFCAELISIFVLLHLLLADIIHPNAYVS